MQRKALKQVSNDETANTVLSRDDDDPPRPRSVRQQRNGADEQLGKVTQWTNEKVSADSDSSCACYVDFQVFSGEKTSLSDDFTEYEKEVDVRRIGIERCVQATSTTFIVRC